MEIWAWSLRLTKYHWGTGGSSPPSTSSSRDRRAARRPRKRPPASTATAPGWPAPRYRAASLPISSGVVERTCRSPVCERLKKSGMFRASRGPIRSSRCAAPSNPALSTISGNTGRKRKSGLTNKFDPNPTVFLRLTSTMAASSACAQVPCHTFCVFRSRRGSRYRASGNPPVHRQRKAPSASTL